MYASRVADGTTSTATADHRPNNHLVDQAVKHHLQPMRRPQICQQPLRRLVRPAHVPQQTPHLPFACPGGG